jgi:hypothetical protein
MWARERRDGSLTRAESRPVSRESEARLNGIGKARKGMQESMRIVKTDRRHRHGVPPVMIGGRMG